MHTAHALLPLKAAHVLRLQPQLISDAVQAFMQRWVWASAVCCVCGLDYCV